MHPAELWIKNLAKVQVTNVQGAKAADGGMFELLSELEVTENFEHARVEIRSIRFNLSHQTLGHLGRSNEIICQLSRPESWKYGKMARVPLSGKSLASLEQARSGNTNVRLGVSFYAELWTPDGITAASDGGTLRMKPSKWLEVLEDMEWLQTRTVEFPLAGSGVPDQFREAVDEYREAVDRMNDGNYLDAVARCRNVLEILDRPLGQPPDRTEWARSSREWSWSKRLAFLYDAIRHPLHVGHHPVDGGEPNRHSTRMILTMVGSVLRYTINSRNDEF